jgi:hypothetical protein
LPADISNFGDERSSKEVVDHYGFGWEEQHSYLSLPVIFGTVGGIPCVLVQQVYMAFS